MAFGWRLVLATAAVLFILFLVVKMRPFGTALGRGRRKLGAAAQAARERAHAAATPQERARALCDAGSAAAREDRRWTSAAGFFLRAMRVDPCSAAPVEEAVAALERARPRLLEKLLWRRLARVPWDAAHAPAVRAAALGLASIYENRLRDPVRAAVMDRLARTLPP